MSKATYAYQDRDDEREGRDPKRTKAAKEQALARKEARKAKGR